MELPEYVKQTIGDLEQKANDFEGQAVALRLTANNIREIFEAAESPPTATPEVTQEKRLHPEPEAFDEPQGQPGTPTAVHTGLRTRKSGSSQYTGVTKLPPLRDGTIRWRAQWWEGKTVHVIGRYDSELLAAAAVAEQRGDYGEARRLRDLAAVDAANEQEQRENNPDRPPKPKRKEAGGVWECRKCCRQHIAASRPAKCEICGSEALKKIA